MDDTATMSTLSAAVLLFLIMDPLGNVPLFLALLRDVPSHRRRIVVVRELIIALVVLLGVVFVGEYVLDFLQLKQPSISIAGGIVLFLIAIRMIFPSSGNALGGDVHGEPFIVPLAIPYVAGPSAMAALLLLTNSHPGRTADWVTALVAAWFVTAVILLSSTYLFRWLGESVLDAIERLMGMVLVALSVQMFLDGVVAYIRASGGL